MFKAFRCFLKKKKPKQTPKMLKFSIPLIPAVEKSQKNVRICCKRDWISG